MKGVVKKSLPFSFDGINPVMIEVGADFPPDGITVDQIRFKGLVDEGFIEEVEVVDADEADIDRALIEALNRRLDSMSDEDLHAIIARRGTPFTGPLVHAVMISEAKEQLLRELQTQLPTSSVIGVAEAPPAAQPAQEPVVVADDEETKAPDLEGMTKAELEAFAASKQIDVSGAKTKAEIIATITNRIALGAAVA